MCYFNDNFFTIIIFLIVKNYNCKKIKNSSFFLNKRFSTNKHDITFFTNESRIYSHVNIYIIGYSIKNN